MSKFFAKGQRFVFTLALFVLAFAAASVVKIQAASNVTGWLWGGSEDKNIGGIYDERCSGTSSICGDGNETGVGEIRMSGTATDAARSEYGVEIPSGGGIISGTNTYAWSENIGWINFSGVNVTTVDGEKRLSGDAWIVAIKNNPASAGGWGGRIKLAADGSNYSNLDANNYGVKIDSSGKFSGYGWNGEESGTGENMASGFGWIDFSKAELPMPIDGLCQTPPNSDRICPGESNPTTMTNDQLCADYDSSNPPSVTGTWDWTCSGQNGGEPMNCHAEPDTPVVPKCGDNVNFCTGNTSSPCASGTPSSFVNEDGYVVSWTYTGSCVDPISTDCTARGRKTCGWIETNP